MMNRMAGRRRARASRGVRNDRSQPIPLPLKGLFIEADNAEMGSQFAARLVNWRSDGTSLVLRPQIETVNSGAGVLQEFYYEFEPNQIYVQVSATGLTSRFQANDAVQANHFQASSGQGSWTTLSSTAIYTDAGNAPLIYDGTSFAVSSFTTDTGVEISTFDKTVAHHDRIYFWDSDGPCEFYFGEVGAITGALTRFPLSRLGNVTGKIAEMKSLTVDAGHGMNDVLCILTTTGQMIIYEGLNPGDANDWRLNSRIQSAPPASKFVFAQVGSDLWMLSHNGIQSVSDVIRRGQAAAVSPITRPITDEIIRRIEADTDLSRWQLHMSSDASMVIVNRFDGTAAEQWIYYTESMTWATADLDVIWWGNFNKQTRGVTSNGDTVVLKRIVDVDGEKILGIWRSSWIRMAPGTKINSITPTIVTNSAATITLAVLSDHDETSQDITEATQTVTIQPDNPGEGVVALNETFGCDASGTVFQIRIAVRAAWAKLVAITANIN